MKLNPKLDYFITNKIENSKENRYILFEEADLQNLKKLIFLSVSKKRAEEILKQYTNDYWTGLLHSVPFKVINDVVYALEYRKKEEAKDKIYDTRNKLFPKWEKLKCAWFKSTLISSLNSTQHRVNSFRQELFGVTIK